MAALLPAGGANQVLEIVVVTIPPCDRHRRPIQEDDARVLDARKVLSVALEVKLSRNVRFAVGMGAIVRCRDLVLGGKDGLAGAAVEDGHRPRLRRKTHDVTDVDHPEQVPQDTVEFFSQSCLVSENQVSQ